jgi:hypothetical protein
MMASYPNGKVAEDKNLLLLFKEGITLIRI